MTSDPAPALQQRLTFTLADQARDRYPRVPFEVPPGTCSLEVEIAFDADLAGVDVGCEGPAGWRGWSGGARRRFVIAADAATPGYLPGPLEPGTWWVVLGLHRLERGSVEVDVVVRIPARGALDLEPDAPAEGAGGPAEGAGALAEGAGGPAEATAGLGEGAGFRGSDRGLPAPPGMRWVAGDFHGHTLHSDGSMSITQLARAGVASGLDFMAVTDHNTVSHHSHLARIGAREGIVLVPGQEVTTHLGHANAFGDIGWIDFRRPAAQWQSEVAERGGVLSINHPVAGDCSWVHEMPQAPCAVEIWHASWFLEPISTAPLAWLRRWHPGVTLIGGADVHGPGIPLPGTPTTWVCVEELSVDGILDALRAGRTAITGTMQMRGDLPWPVLDAAPVLLREGDAIRAIGGAGHYVMNGAGARVVVDSNDEMVPAPRDAGPYVLLRPDRTPVALCA